MSVYKRALSRVNYLELVKETGDVVVYKNKSNWSLF